ncbi:MAG TPA: FAD-dependent monooxygenase, partial [Bdellovibrionota bacterium]
RWEDVNPRIFRELDIKIDKVHWFSTYHVHHRVAATFQKGRAFLLGDAGHIHSPVGGQGMNTGIGDAVNLAWRLGEVLQGRAKANILETYNTERIAFAERLVRTVDRAFEFITASGRWARIVRTKFVPVALRALVSLPAIRRLMFRTVSQTNITYRDQSENQGRAVGIQSGDRLPWIESVDNFEPLKSLAWQIHVYGQRNMQALDTSLPLHRFPWSEEMARKGLKEGAAYHIRPDGYVGRVL